MDSPRWLGLFVLRIVHLLVLVALPLAPATGRAAELSALTLERALALTLEGSPKLAARSRALEAEAGNLLQAGVTPNPRAELTVEDVVGSGGFTSGRRAESTLRIAKLVELGGKRGARVDLAGRAYDLAQQELETERSELAAEVTKRFGHVLADQAALDLHREGTRLALRALATVRSQTRAGRLADVEERKARILVARAHIEEEHAEHELRSARRRLVALWGETEPDFSVAEGDLFHRIALPTLDAVLGGIGQAPAIRRAAAEQARRAADVRLAEARAMPDLDLAAGPRRYEGEDAIAMVFGVTIPLPVFDRNQGAIEEARARLREADEDRRAVGAKLQAELYGALQELRHADTELEVLEREIVPDARETLRLTENGFELGRHSYVELLDSQRTFVAVGKQRIKAARDLWRLRARLSRLLGAMPS